MKLKLGFLLLLLSTAFLAFTACQSQPQNAQSPVTGDTPTAAYKRVFEAVKKKDTAAIKKEMSSTTQAFALSLVEMRKQSEEEIYKNGFFESMMNDSFPQLRDERVKDNYAAIEAITPKGTWEDVPFVKENGAWKIAVGDVFQNTYQSPGKPASAANANTQIPQVVPAPNTNTNANVQVIPMPSGNANANANAAQPKTATDKLKEKKAPQQ